MPCLLSDNGLPVCAMCEQVDRYKVVSVKTVGGLSG